VSARAHRSASPEPALDQTPARAPDLPVRAELGEEPSPPPPSQTPLLDAAGLSTDHAAAPAAATPAPATTPAQPPVIHREVSETVSETISNAPAAHSAWNGTYGWTARFALDIDRAAGTLTIAMRLTTGAAEEVRRAWEQAIEAKWGGGRFRLAVAPQGEEPARSYAIHCDVSFVDTGGHYTVTANAPGATASGRAGLGGTTSMTAWGTTDTVDVTHEFGHMLGAREDYFTTDGVDHTHGGTVSGFRDPGGGVMNNPSEDPLARHLDLVRRQAALALGVAESRCTVS
jgi:hypothetical protein